MTAPDAHLDAQVRAVEFARAILRSEAPHTVGSIREACNALMTYGDGLDCVEARHMLAALDKRKTAIKRDVPIQRPPYSQGHGTIRAILLGATLGVWGIWMLLVVVLAM